MNSKLCPLCRVVDTDVDAAEGHQDRDGEEDFPAARIKVVKYHRSAKNIGGM